MLILFYADMKQDLQGTVAKVATFLGTDSSEQTLAKVAEKSAFAYMKAIDDKFLPFPKGTMPWGDMEMMRQGKTGNSRELLSIEQQQGIDAWCRAELRRLGSDFPYAQFLQAAK